MQFFTKAVNFPADMKKYWTDTVFSANLIAANAGLAQQGYSLRLTYPYKDNADPLNIAEMPCEGQQLGSLLVKNWVEENNCKLEQRNSNWVLLAHILLDNTVCYLESPSAKYRTKAIVTRNLHIANSLSAHPIQNFDLFYRIISLDYDFFDDMKSSQPQLAPEVNAIVNIMQQLEGTMPKIGKQVLEWLSTTFNTEQKLVKVYVEAQYSLSADVYNSCIEGKCAYIKLKSGENGFLEMPTRVTGTKYAVPASTILVPISFMREQARVIMEHLKSGIVLTRFRRDNDIVRDMLSSANPDVLSMIFPAETKFCSVKYLEDRGYIHCTDICNSAYDGDTARAISLARVLGVQFITPDLSNLVVQLQPYGFHPSFARTDFKAVIPAFKTYVSKMRDNMKFLVMLYSTLTNQDKVAQSFTSPYQVEDALYQYVDLQATLTSSFVRSLHLYMLSNPLLFPNYTGAPQDLTNFSYSSSPKFQSLGTL